MATLRGVGKSNNRNIMSNPRGTLAVDSLDGATTFLRNANGWIIQITMLDEFGRQWHKHVTRDGSDIVTAIGAWCSDTSSSTSSTTSSTSSTSSTTSSTSSTSSTTSTLSTSSTISTSSTTTGA